MKPTIEEIKRLIKATTYSYKGIIWAWKNEAAFRLEVYLSIVLLPVALFANVSAIEKVLLVGSLGLVFIVELINSAIEAVVDRMGSEIHELSGAAKDSGSAAVFFAVMLAVFTWTEILILKYWQ